ncbi:MAG TPA: ABC transporter substrate-binding protein [Casimicrobiaceae bacterium]|nr:ABC transporter substrate-binding protein [Casimicrobiaceae bacterium]
MRPVLAVALAMALCVGSAPLRGAPDAHKVLRLAINELETLDPQQYAESPSYDVLRAIYEGLYQFDYLADPPRLVPVTASAPPQISADGRTWIMRLQPGIYFTDDPAFKGRRRELTADDYVYSLKRWLDPSSVRGGAPITAGLIVGGREALDEAARSGRFDLDRPIEGIRALDRYTVQLTLTEANYPIIEGYVTLGAVAREVVEARGGDLRAYAVGTGPFKLREWKRGTRLTLDANPDYRAIRFPASAEPALARTVGDAPFPRIGSIELMVIEEDGTRLLEFDRGNIDAMVLRSEVATRLVDGDRLRPEYAARGIGWQRVPEPYLVSLYINLRDPQVGGMDPPHIALRRAMALALDRGDLVKVVYAGQALPANQMAPPGVVGHDPALPKQVLHDPAAARALLDRYGFRRGADGFRTAPDGAPLVLNILLRSAAVSREIQTLLKKNFEAVSLRTTFTLSPFQDAVKDISSGHYQMWFGGFGGTPTAVGIFSQLYSKAAPQINLSHFGRPDYDAAIERFMSTRDPAGQLAAARTMAEIERTYVPTIPVVFRLENWFVQPWLKGFRANRFDNYWKYLDVETPAQRPARRTP